jgi:hypothetical protein
MANVDSPMGFIPIGHLTGSFIPEPHEYILTAGQTIYKGDPVIITSAGTVSIGAAAQTTTNLGIAAEYKYSASAGAKIKVYDDPKTLYMVQVTTGVTPGQTECFNCSDIVTYAAGSSITKQSIMELDTPAATTTTPWLILGLYPQVGNAWGEHAKVVCIYTEHVFIAAYAGL